MQKIVLGGAALLLASLTSVACSEDPDQPLCASDSECLQGQICQEETGSCIDANAAADAGTSGADASNPPPPPPPQEDAGRPGRADAGPLEVPDGGQWLAQVVFDRSEGAAEDPLAGARVSATVLEPSRSGFCAGGASDEPAAGVECCYTGRPHAASSYNAGEITATAAGTSVALPYESGVYAAQPIDLAAGNALRATVAGHALLPGGAAGPITLPANLQLSAPAAGASASRAGFDVTWNGATSPTARALISVVQLSQSGVELGSVACLVPDNGTFKLDTSLLQELNAGAASLVVQRLAQTAPPAASGVQLVGRNGARIKLTLK